jgi:16S rRNA (cytosine1402-N4)-methyltransferase
MEIHIPVLKEKVLEYLNPQPNENFIDATINGGGHAFAILEKTGPNGKLLGIEWDEEIFKNLKAKFENTKLKERIIIVNDNFKNLKKIIEKENFQNPNGIIFDLGFSSWHIEKSKRGFSFMKDEILDMRYDKKSDLRAIDILNKWQERDIEKILREYGEEKYSKKIAKAIVEERRKKPILKTSELSCLVEKIVRKRGKIHPSTKTFQALRIAVNQELENLKEVLPQAIEVLKSKGRLVIISFHSLEDRIVKNFFKEKAKEGVIEILTKKPIIPSKKEIKENPRSRSAKLRAIKKI